MYIYFLKILVLIDITENFKVSRKIYVTDSDPTLFIFATNIHTTLSSFCTFWDTERLTKEEAKECLKSIPEWNWNQRFMVCRMDSSLATQVENMILQRELSSESLRREQENHSFALELVPENLPEISLPKGFKFGELKPHHVSLIFAHWKCREGESIVKFEEYIRVLPTAAVYREEDNESENPVSWVLLYNYGAIGSTYTLSAFRRLGLATAVVVNLCKKLMKYNIYKTVDIDFHNDDSVALHKKIGFKNIGEVYWNIYTPNNN